MRQGCDGWLSDGLYDSEGVGYRSHENVAGISFSCGEWALSLLEITW